MKLHKKTFILGTIITILTFSISLILYNETKSTLNFLYDISLALFSGCIVLMITSVLGYFSERKKYETRYATFIRDFLLRIARFINAYEGTNINSNEVYNIASELHAYYDSFAYEEDYEIFGYFFKNGKRKMFIQKVHESANKYAHEISRIIFESGKALHNNENILLSTNITPKELDETMKLISQLFSYN